MTDEFRYRAFLSYSHVDEAVATRLHRALEHYTLPRRVRKAHGLPRRLIPIFRDVDELAAASGLTTRLQDALDQSRWLIVLCSPAAARSKYVNQEIEYFLQKHGASRILCALVQGEPPESFPSAIRALSEEPLAADFRPGKDFELPRLKLIAALAGVGFTELRSREAQRKKRQRILAAATLAGIGLSGLAYWDLFHREHVDYYANYVRRHGIWEGMDHISPALAARRAASYRFIRNGRLHSPHEVAYVNGGGHCLAEGMKGPLGQLRTNGFGALRQRYCLVRFDYRENGQLARESWLNNTGRMLASLTYTEDGLAQFTQQGFAAAEGGSGVFYVQATRDERGFDARVQFLQSLGNPRSNERHEFGWVLSYDDDGRITRRSVLDDHGQEVGLVTHYTYDARGLVTQVLETDLKDQPQIRDGGFSSRLSDYDSNGNLVRERFLLPDGSPATASRSLGSDFVLGGDFVASGFAAVTYQWDARGNILLWQQFDGAGNPVNGPRGYAAERMSYDAQGNMLRQATLDAQGKPVATASEGVAMTEWDYDLHGNIIEERSYGADGKLAAHDYGPAIIRVTFDEASRTHLECLFDTEGKPMIARYGACYRWSFDVRDNPISVDFLGTDGKPYARPDSGVARTAMHRDDRGRLIGVSHYGADLKPVISRSTGAASSERQVDEFGNTTEIRRYDTHHRLIRDKDGIAVSRARFDHSGNRIEETYFDEAQRPVRSDKGYFGYRAAFDSRGRMIRREFLDAHGGLTALPPMNAYGTRYEYNSFGSVTVEVYLDQFGADGGRMEHHRNAFDQETEKVYLTAARVSTRHPASGCATERLEYDGYGRIVVERCLGVHGEPLNRRDGGWAVKKVTPQVSNVNDETYYDAAGRKMRPRKKK